MDDKFTQILSLLKKIASQNQLYVWLLILTLFLGAFSSLHKDFFSSEKDIAIAAADTAALRKIPQEELFKILDKDKLLSRLLGITFLFGLLIFSAGIYLLVRFLPGIIKHRTLFASGGMNMAHWTILDILRAVIIIIFFTHFLYVAEPLFFRLFNLVAPNIFARLFFKSLAVDMFALGVVLYFVIAKYAADFVSLGLDFGNFVRNLKIGLVHYIALIPILLMVVLVSITAASVFKYEPEPAAVFAIFFGPQPKIILLLFILFITVFGPIIEEIFFRGFCYPALRKKVGPFKSAVSVSIIFAWLHMNMIGFLPIFLLGLLLVYLYEKTNSLVASIVVHVIHNSAVLYLVFLYRCLVLK